MATAVLYIRVSTDEQATKGYSLINQEERLKRFCVASNIRILQAAKEDFSAKTFKRPTWSSLMAKWRREKTSRPDLLLFTRWDRFSRNATEAYSMIDQLQQMGITPQAIDQLLDLKVPENKLLLAMFIVTSEVENDRKSLNVKLGMHKAKAEGRWLGKAPFGYISQFSKSGKKVLVPYEPEALLVRKIFNEVVRQKRRLYRYTNRTF